MVKSDSHMARIRQRLLDEQASIKKSELKRKEREGKKFGKQLQIEKVKERAKSKKDMEARLSNLKRSACVCSEFCATTLPLFAERKDVLDQPNDNEGDDFDVVVEDAISDRPRSAKRIKESADGAPKSRSKMPRHDRNTKFGFGSGAGKRSKQNTRDSTDDFASAKPKGKFGGKGKFGVRRPDGPAKPERRSAAAKGRGKVTKRPGKSKRQSSRN
jgi:rRNA-processing protein EBP2